MLPWGAAPARPARSARMLRVRWAAGGGAENQVAPPCRQSRTQKTCPVPWRTGCFRVFPTWCPMPGARRGSDSDLGGQSCPRPRGAWAPASRGRSSTGREVTCPKAPEGRPARESEVFQSCPTLCDPWTVVYQAPQSMGFSGQGYWSGLPFPSPGGSSRPRD